MNQNKMFQVSTLQALALGYSRGVITCGELICHGNTGLGTFEDVAGEMIFIDGHVYCADAAGKVREVSPDTGVPFASVGFLTGSRREAFGEVSSLEEMKNRLNLLVDDDFGLNSMYIVRIDGAFGRIAARSERPHRSHHVALAEILQKTGTDFEFADVKGTMVCLYHPDYMDGINAPGWHFHFISEDRTFGGHVFDFSMTSGNVIYEKLNAIEIRFPTDKAFDTYSLKKVSADDIKKVEQGQS